jgi:radical SAM protein
MPHPIRNLRSDVEERPFIVIWEVTRACALACAHCRADAVTCRDPRELSTAQGKALLDDLASYAPPRPMVVLTGGDPFERSDLGELVAYGTAAGLHVSLAPSVTPKLTIDALEELRRSGASAVSLSIDGAGPATHDGFRGIAGTFAATLRAAADVRAAGLRLQVNTTVTAANVHELPAILELLGDLDVGLWSVFFLVPTGRGRALDALGPREVEDVLWWLHDVGSMVAIKATEAPHYRRVALQRAAAPEPADAWPRTALGASLRAATTWRRPPAAAPVGGRPPLNVNAGRGFAFISHIGDVQPSGFLAMPVGSIAERAFSQIYRDAPLFRALRDPGALGGRCGRCEFRSDCGGSRSRAFAVYGDPFAEDPACCYQPTGVEVDVVA